MNTRFESLVAALNLSHVVNNPIPPVEGLESVLYGSANRKLWLAVTKMETVGIADVFAALEEGLNSIKKLGVADNDVYSNDRLPAYLRESYWRPELMKFATADTPVMNSHLGSFIPGIYTDMWNTSIVTEDGYLVSITEIYTNGPVNEELANDLLTGKSLTKKVIETMQRMPLSQAVH